MRLDESEFVRVANTSDIPTGGCKVIPVEGRRPIALFNVGGQLYACDNECAHSGGPLGQGELDGAVVTCPWHGWTFDVRTGKGAGITNEAARVPTYEVKVEGDDVLVKLV